MFQKKFKQFMAATISAAMLVGQVQYANAADIDESTNIDLTEDYDLTAESEDSLGNYEDISTDFVPVEELEVIDDEETEESEGIEDAEEPVEVIVEEPVTEEPEEVSDGDVTEAAEEASDEASVDSSVEDEAALMSEETELPAGIVGMAEGYELTASEAAVKAESVTKKDTYFKDFSSLEEGKDYAKDEVVFLAETKEHAEEVAAAYAGSLKSFENGVAVIDLSESEVSVESAYSCAFIDGLNLPVVTPNYFFAYDELTSVDADYLGLFKETASEESAAEVSEDETVDVTKAPEEEVLEDIAEDDTVAYEESSDEEASEDAEEAEDEEAEEAEETEEEAEEETSEELPDFMSEPYFDPASDEYQWHHQMVDSYSAWLSLGKDGLNKTSDVVVAVIDDGIADISELNLVNEASVEGSHGTMVAGVIGAGINENGGAGIAPGVKLLNLKTDLTSAGVMSQLRTAVENKADVINMSFGGSNIDPQMTYVIDEVNAAGVTMVAAVSSKGVYPAAYENVIAVAAVNEAGKIASYVADASYADIAAPGSNIWTTDETGNYVMVSGSALASSVVAGAAALYMTKFGHVAPADIKAALVDTADVLENVNVVNASKLIGAASRRFGATTSNVASVRITTSANASTYNVKTDKKGAVKSASIYYEVGTQKSITLSAKFLDKAGNSVSSAAMWTSSKPGVASVNASGVVTGLSKGKTTITCKDRNGSKKASVTIEVRKTVTSLEVTGSKFVTPGSKPKYKVKANSDASSKAVTWKVSGASGVTVVPTTGQLIIDQYVSNWTKVTLTATANDPAHKQASYTVTIRNKAKKVEIKRSGAVTKKITLGLEEVVDVKKEATVSVSADNGAPIVWSDKYDHNKISLVKNSNGSYTIKAKTTGTVTLTAATDDGSGKKAKLTVKVINPVTQIYYEIRNQNPNILAEGGKMKFYSTPYGKNKTTPTVKKLKWRVVVSTNSRTLTDDEAKHVATISGGTVKTKKNATDWIVNNGFSSARITVYAGSTDGSNAYWPLRTVNLVERVNKYYRFGLPQGAGTWTHKEANGRTQNYNHFILTIRKYIGGFKIGEEKHESWILSRYPFEVSSTNESILHAECVPDTVNSGYYCLQITSYGRSGTATVKIRTLDGSNIKTSGKFKVIPKK